MIYQLVHHDGQAAEFVAQSPDLKTEQERDQWYAQQTQGMQPPPGRQWAVLDPSHAWFKDMGASPWGEPAAASQEPMPAGAGTQAKHPIDDVGPTNPPVQMEKTAEGKMVPRAKTVAGEQPDFNDIMRDSQARWDKERIEDIEDEREIQRLLRNRKRRQ